MYRQGDVLLVSIPEVPDAVDLEVAPLDGRYVLAKGEATGHIHTVAADDVYLMVDMAPHPQVRPTRTGGMHNKFVPFLRVHRPTQLRHEEHDSIELPPGDYSILEQREFDPAPVKVANEDSHSAEVGQPWRFVTD